MLFSAGLVLEHPEKARLWLAVRALDRPGHGWVKTPHKKLCRASGMAESTVRRHLKEGLGCWFQQVERCDGQTFVRLRSSKRIEKELNPRSKARGVIAKDKIRDSELLAQRAALVAVLQEQHKVEGKLHHLRLRGKLQGPVFGHREALAASRTSAKPASGGQTRSGRNILLSNEHQATLGLSLETLAKKLDMSRNRLQRLLKDAPKVQLHRPITPKQAFEETGPVWILCDDDNARYQAYRALPCLYLDRGVSAVSRRRLLRDHKLLRTLTPAQWQVARLGALQKKGKLNDREALDYIHATGWKKFLRNTNRVAANPRPDRRIDMSGKPEFKRLREQLERKIAQQTEYTWEEPLEYQDIAPD